MQELMLNRKKNQNNKEVEVKPNNRRHDRHAAIWSIKGALLCKGQFQAISENISSSGLLLKTPYQIKPGTKAHLRVSTFVAGKSHIIDAIVVFRHVSLSGSNYRCGAEFIRLNNGSKEFIQRYINGKNPHEKDLV